MKTVGKPCLWVVEIKSAEFRRWHPVSVFKSFSRARDAAESQLDAQLVTETRVSKWVQQ